ncbi:ABC transporter substrate-binding protein [Alsobacter sp. SYSU M60028]|uniref:ABC transporter substrate-binding protein n=1 Tax=Alsobacter ponti TaxID=2962936 RepID=A0ABT1LDN7_9HYPH|nr:ABC transporter substrate-binding protein [Alsobacter ponti]MCP8939208.1 ABC transporter substrate-binding protein [Alsobacter ponti]
MTDRTVRLTRRSFHRLAAGALAAAAAPAGALAQGFRFQEAPALAELVKQGKLPPVEERLPKSPLIADFDRSKRQVGRYGGEARTLAARARDLRYISVSEYTRLVGYNAELEFEADLAQSYENDNNRVFTFTLREGHKWSDGRPFTTEDFRYYWEEIALNKELSPTGPPETFLVEGKLPKIEILDEQRIRYSWDKPNPRFLPALAQPRPLTLFSPHQYLRQFHRRHRDKGELEQMVAKAKVKSWAALHNRMDDAYENANPDMPTLNAWRIVTAPPATRFVFERNPYFHRVDPQGQQLPYVDRIVVDIAAAGLFAAKANAGEVDLLARGLSMNDVPVLKEGEGSKKYRTLLWRYGRGSAYAFYPNLNANDPVWRALNRDVRYRRALSAAIDRRILNNALLFGLGSEGNNTVLPESPLYTDAYRTTNATFDPALADRLLDEIGLKERDSVGIRKLPDGRIMEIIVEVDGESADIIDALQLVTEMWRDVGIKLFVKPQERTILRQRSYSGVTVMVAAGGLDNAMPTPHMPPTELAPVRQDNYSWPKWGQWAETSGKNGEEPDIDAARALLKLYKGWMQSSDPEEMHRIWSEMLTIHAEQQFSIGTVGGELQPVVINTRTRNMPEKAIFSYDPTALMGIYRIEELWMEPASS